MAGRKRKPTKLHVVQGTYRADRHAAPEAPVSPDDPVVPAHFDDEHRRRFLEVVEVHRGLGLASATYQQVYEMVAIRRVEVDESASAIEEHGRVYITVNKLGERMVKANPAVAMRSEALRHLQSLYAELGLTPAARSKVAAPDKPKPDGWSAFK